MLRPEMFYVDEIIQLAKPPNDTGQTLEEYKSTVTHAGELTVQERTARHSLKEPRVRVADTQATVRSLFSPNFLRDGSACSLPFGWGPGLPFGKARLLPFEDV